MKIVITGVLGNIGKPLTENLIARNHEVIGIYHKPEGKATIESLGATAAIGSIEDVSFLTKIVKEADAVFCMNPPNFLEDNQLAYYKRIANNYAEAIQNSHIKRVVYLSSYGAHLPTDTGFITGSYHAEQILNALPDISLTHLRPTSFYYNLNLFINMIKHAGFIGGVYGGNDLLAMVSPIDIATAAAEELEVLEDVQKIRYVSSDDRSCNEVAHILGKAIGKPHLEWRILSPEVVKQSLLQNGLSENAASNLVELGLAIHTGKLREDFDQNRPAMGKIKLEDFAKDFAELYGKQ